jgi:drug/metabolite transporter (DMT)-like permease
VAGLGVAVGQTAFTFGVSMTSAANTGFIFATAPIWGLLLGLMLGLERPAWGGVFWRGAIDPGRRHRLL